MFRHNQLFFYSLARLVLPLAGLSVLVPLFLPPLTRPAGSASASVHHQFRPGPVWSPPPAKLLRIALKTYSSIPKMNMCCPTLQWFQHPVRLYKKMRAGLPAPRPFLVVNIIPDELMRTAVDRPFGSRRSEVVTDTVGTLSSINVQLPWADPLGAPEGKLPRWFHILLPLSPSR